MTTIKIQFKVQTSLLDALEIIKDINSHFVITDKRTLMCELNVFDLDKLPTLNTCYCIDKVSLFKNDIETIKGLF